MKGPTKILLVVASLLYPFLIFYGTKSWGLEFLQFILAGLLLLYLFSIKKGNSAGWLWVAVCLILIVWMTVRNDALPAKLYPVAISLGLCVLFVVSLFRPPSMIERFARLRDADLSEKAVHYTRQVTRVWVVFFVVNASVSAYTGLFMTDEYWLLYNGFVSYMLMGTLFAGEWLVRRNLIKRQ